MRISILSGSSNGSSVFSETHVKTTDALGLISLQIGMGTLLSGAFNNINWGNLAHFIKLEADFNGGTRYELLGTQELMSVPYALYAIKTDTSVLNLTSRLATKLNLTDTASLSERIDNKLNKTDTSLLNLTSRLATKLNVTDTAFLSERIDNKLNKTDTSLLNLTSRLATKLNVTDTAFLSDRIDSKLSKTDTSLLNLTSRLVMKLNVADTAYLSNRIDAKLSKTDTSLLKLTSRLATKLNVTDTAYLSERIDNKLNKTDTSLLNLTSRLNTKVNVSDTSTMLANYRTGLDEKAFVHSPNFTGTVGGINKSMIGLSVVDNTTDADKPISTAAQTALDIKVNKSDTVAMLLPYLRDADTTSMLLPYLQDADTTAMLANYRMGINSKVNILDTLNMLLPYLRDADTTSMLSTYLRKTDAIITDLQEQVTLLQNNINVLNLSTGNSMDIDGNIYQGIRIGGQVWMKENLKVSRYRNGDLIPIVADPTAWSALITGGRSWYNNDSTTYENPYGNLYNYYAVVDTRGLCPVEWHVPSDAEWTILTTYLGGESNAGGKMKSKGTANWITPNTSATNESGFSVLPGGSRSVDGSFNSIGYDAFFWCATEDVTNSAFARFLNYSNSYVFRITNGKSLGASVRCLRD